MTDGALDRWKAFVLAAGFGTRMRPLTETRPKPLVEVRGHALIDHVLDRICNAGIATAVVNVHYLADQLEAHIDVRRTPSILVSDERDELLETGGGIVRALPLLGGEPFFLLNSDSIWWETGTPALQRMAQTWDAARMDALLLLVPIDNSTGYDGAGDFEMAASGQLTRRRADRQGLVYMGIAILHPTLFDKAPEGAFSLNLLFDTAIAAGRLYGMVHNGEWMHVGTPQAIGLAERRLDDLEAKP